MKFIPSKIWLIILFLSGVTCGVLLSKFLFKFQDRLQTSQASQAQELPTIPNQVQGKMSLYVLAGQSNMTGRGPLDAESSKTHPQVFVFGNDYRWHLAKDPLDSIDGQVDPVSQEGKAPGVGPGMTFASALLKHDKDAVIGLIPCARGGSTIQEWQRNLSENSLYGSCLKRLRAASLMGQLEGMLFFQGEADALDQKQFSHLSLSPQQWSKKFEKFIESFRLDTKQENLPIVFAQIGSHDAPDLLTQWNVVKKQQENIQLPQVAMITTDDLALEDYVHYTTKSYRTIGQRFANAYIKLTEKNL
ncbi:sialate O-acetylesterase [Acaryochloris sp. CCMEE 5410]|nr:sialate O-acetylesterase [Acaryochloris sp. CCMEE 5410]